MFFSNHDFAFSFTTSIDLPLCIALGDCFALVVELLSLLLLLKSTLGSIAFEKKVSEV